MVRRDCLVPRRDRQIQWTRSQAGKAANVSALLLFMLSPTIRVLALTAQKALQVRIDSHAREFLSPFQWMFGMPLISNVAGNKRCVGTLGKIALEPRNRQQTSQMKSFSTTPNLISRKRCRSRLGPNIGQAVLPGHPKMAEDERTGIQHVPSFGEYVGHGTRALASGIGIPNQNLTRKGEVNKARPTFCTASCRVVAVPLLTFCCAFLMQSPMATNHVVCPYSLSGRVCTLLTCTEISI